MLCRRAAGCGPGWVWRGRGRPSFAAAHLGALGSCVPGPGTSLPTGFYWAQPLAAFALKGRFAFQSAGTPAGEGGEFKPPTPVAGGPRRWVTLGSTEDPASPLLSSPHSCPHGTGHGPFVAAGFGDAGTSWVSPTRMPQRSPPVSAAIPTPGAGCLGLSSHIKARPPAGDKLRLPSALSPRWGTPNPCSGVILSARFGKRGLVGREGSRSPCVHSIQGQTNHSNPHSKPQPGPGKRDRGTEPAVCRGNAPTMGPTGRPWAPTCLREACDPVERGFSCLFSHLNKQKHPHTFSDRENQAEMGPS